MDIRNGSHINAIRQPWLRAAAAVGALTLVASGCAEDKYETEVSSTSTFITTTTETSTTIAAVQNNDLCIGPIDIPVAPGSRLSQDNIEDLDGQLDALRVAHDSNAKVTFNNVRDALAISANSMIDPKYAEAFMYANNHLSPDTRAASLFELPLTEGADCLQEDQVKRAAELSRILVEGFAPKVGSQMGEFAQAAYEELVNIYEKLKAEYHEWLA